MPAKTIYTRDAALWQRMKERAKAQDISESRLIERYIRYALDIHERAQDVEAQHIRVSFE